ncbi:MAG: hypothetical protein HZA02_03165 [Nitrospinae bacterium]|nr:hypothetical protein [Nitrospinota bacterium]
MTIVLQTENIDNVSSVLRQLKDAALAGARRAAEETVREAARSAKGRALRNSHPRRFGDAIDSEIRSDAFQVWGRVASSAPFAGFIEFGTRPHEIRAKNRKALFWRGARAPVKKVRHPGTQGYHIIGQAVEDAVGGLRETLDLELERALRGRSL